MKLQFLGHGLHDNNTNTVGDWLISTFKDSDYHSFIGFSAFTKMSGINRIKNELLIAQKQFKSLKFYLGIVESGTSKEALEFFINNNIETYIYCTSENLMFHPKIYSFEGKYNSRFITGSSNLTSPGLFNNIEASTLIEFSHSDAQGKKYVRQFTQYFSTVLNNENENVQLLTNEVLQDLINSGFVYDESQTRDDFEFTKRNKELNKKRTKKKFSREELGKQKSLQKSTKKYDYELRITPDYIKSWPKLFEEFKSYKNENSYLGSKYSVTVPRDYKNPTLYGWYRKQKVFFKNNLIPKEHLELLKKEDFYFGDAHKLWQEFLEDQKLELLMDALIDEEDIKVNHRYEYKGVKLGTWLVGVSQANKKGKKLELRQKIIDLGFYISATSRNPIDSANRFVIDLLDAKNPDKANFQNRFNSTIRDRIDEIPKDIQQDIVEAWFLQFNEDRPLGRIRERKKDRTDEWKEFRYNKNINKNEKWLEPVSIMGDVFWWARQKRESKSRMDLIKNNFTEQEKVELRTEGFPI
ncbi:phospholipase D family protein [Tenacibaculum finnmarkense genomovar ulcerans]|uniref:phospholipase D family protein n=1 Tax=Tenacibaculum finnmarkense TaxID=2781243 RepID=UPI001E5E27B9|nr:phospholipase D family protein [Tenacibaculum finnmarkense]MCD8455209.1 phospholipase D family protein [Tenacibaculum finnmarkense genomovar ulcerans]